MQPDAAIFNSMIAACAHGGEFAKARLMFDSMAEHNCQPDAVTFANLIRAYKKGGQWYADPTGIHHWHSDPIMTPATAVIT